MAAAASRRSLPMRLSSLPSSSSVGEAAAKGPAGADARLVVFPGAFHELFHGPDKDEVVRVVREWIGKHGGGGGGEKAKM